MSNHGLRAGVLLGALLVPAAAGAGVAPELAACRAIDDPTERVACYDAAVDAARAAAEPSRPSGPAGPERAEPVSPAPRGFADPEPAAPEFLEARVEGVTEDPYGKLIIELDNAQVWSQLDSARLRLRPGDAVRIEAAVSGSYLLEKLPGSRLIRVTRVR